MQYLVTAEEMRRYDGNTTERIGIPAIVLMERAALAAWEAVSEYCRGREAEKKTALVMAGMGNNGADGLALARLLAEKGFGAEVWCVEDSGKASDLWDTQRRILENWPVEFVTKPSRGEYTVVIDALFGVGLSREIEGKAREAVARFNAVRGYKIALDLPSGIDSDTGIVRNCAVRVDETVTFGFCKRGLRFFPGREYAGKIKVADIGVSPAGFFDVPPEMILCDETERELLPRRAKDGNKGTFGKVLLAAGSRNMAGAAALAARACYRVGAGMVKVITPEENRQILQAAVPEALLGQPEDLKEGMEWADVIALGPGIGTSDEAARCLEMAVQDSGKPILLDADGLNLLAGHMRLQNALAKQGGQGRRIVLTPHMGELSRLTGVSIEDLKKNPVSYGEELSRRFHAAAVIKDAVTVVCAEECPACLCEGGNSGMATAGTGDVLAGAIAGLMAQGLMPYQASIAGVRLHELAGRRAAAQWGEHACMASDVALMLGVSETADRFFANR